MVSYNVVNVVHCTKHGVQSNIVQRQLCATLYETMFYEATLYEVSGKCDIEILSIEIFQYNTIRGIYVRDKTIEIDRSIISRDFDMIMFDNFQ